LLLFLLFLKQNQRHCRNLQNDLAGARKAQGMNFPRWKCDRRTLQTPMHAAIVSPDAAVDEDSHRKREERFSPVALAGRQAQSNPIVGGPSAYERRSFIALASSS
jgi:hypothetical protein